MFHTHFLHLLGTKMIAEHLKEKLAGRDEHEAYNWAIGMIADIQVLSSGGS
jgi:hypothetical protein